MPTPPGGQEIFILSYNSYADLISDNQASGTFSQLNLSPLYSVGGMAVLYTGSDGNGNDVPEPATIVLVLLGLSFLSISIRRKDDVSLLSHKLS